MAQASRPGEPDPLTVGSGRPYRQLDVLVVSPPPGGMGRLAERIHEQCTSGLGRLCETDSWLLGKALRGAGDLAAMRDRPGPSRGPGPDGCARG